MTGIRQRITDAVVEKGYFGSTDRAAVAQGLVDVMLSVPGIGVVELPEFNEEYGCFSGGGYPCIGDPESLIGAPGGMVRAALPKYMPPPIARLIAGALLAAANAAEGVS